MFGELPAWGFYVRHAEGLQMKNVVLKLKKFDYRPAIVFDDVDGLKLNELNIKGDKKQKKILKNNVRAFEKI